MILRPRSGSEICLGQGNVALIGEAAGWISPSSAEGLSYAFRSAVGLAGAMADGLDAGLNAGVSERYRRQVWPMFANLAVKRIKCPVLYQPLLRRAVMYSGCGAVRVVSDK